MKNSSKVFVNSLIYSCSGLITKCFGFFLLPLYLAHVSTREYGIFNLSRSFIESTSFIVAFSLYSSIMRFYVDLKDKPNDLRRFYGSVSIFALISGTFFFAVFSFFNEFLSHYVFSGLGYYPIIIISLLGLIFRCQQIICDSILKSQQRALENGIASIVYFLILIILNIVFAVHYKKGAYGLLLACLISDILYSMFFFIKFYREKTIIFCLDFGLLKEALMYSVPIIPHNLSPHLAVLVSSILIGKTNSLSGLGLYAIAMQFGTISDTIHIYINKAYGPWLYEKLNSEESSISDIRKIVKTLVFIIGSLFLGLAFFSQDYIFIMMSSNYSDSWKLVPLIILVYCIKTAYYFFIEVLFYYKDASRKLFLSTLCSSFINIFFSYLFIPLYGAYGAILSFGISTVFRVGIVICISKFYTDIGLRIKDFILNFVCVAITLAIGFSMSYLEAISKFDLCNFIFKVFVFLIYISILIYKYRNELNNNDFIKKRLKNIKV